MAGSHLVGEGGGRPLLLVGRLGVLATLIVTLLVVVRLVALLSVALLAVALLAEGVGGGLLLLGWWGAHEGSDNARLLEHEPDIS